MDINPDSGFTCAKRTATVAPTTSVLPTQAPSCHKKCLQFTPALLSITPTPTTTPTMHRLSDCGSPYLQQIRHDAVIGRSYILTDHYIR